VFQEQMDRLDIEVANIEERMSDALRDSRCEAAEVRERLSDRVIE